MWEGERSLANGAQLGARSPSPDARPVRVAGGHAVERAKPVRADTIVLSPGISARRAFATILATYSTATAENLRCVLTESDPEGAHQLRVTLRRLRTCLRVFKPIIRREPAKRIGWVARYIGAIVGELRDADVIIEEMIPPALDPGVLMPRPIVAWREDIRTKVRASLQAAGATGFANDLRLLAESGGWRAKSRGSRPSAATLINAMLDAMEARTARLGSRMISLTAGERHELRKGLKIMRYTAELSAAYDERAAAMGAPLKRLQSVLGELNDMHMLATLGNGVGLEPEALMLMRRLLADEHVRLAPSLIASANKRWLELAANAPLRATNAPAV